MKKIAMSFVLATSMLVAAEGKYEITPVVGANFFDSDTKVEDDSALFGVRLQSNVHNYKGIKPELAIDRMQGVKSSVSGGEETDVTRAALNGVYDNFKLSDKLNPYVLAGVGYEEMNGNPDANEDGVFGNVGAGLKYALDKGYNVKLEVKQFFKEHSISQTAATVGLGIPLGLVEEPKAPVIEAAPAPVPAQRPAPAPAPEPAPIDSDGDGVVDTMDSCPDTPAGFKVDVNGCPATMKLEVHFVTNTAKIIPESDVSKVEAFANFMKDNPVYKVVIGGHTDSRGTDEYNLRLSQRRADKVANMLVDFGVDANRVKAIGYGESFPISINTTKDGMLDNRRIEAKLVY
jgi:OOP family OmpA-OmpF porin